MGPRWDCLSRACRPAIAHDVFDLATMESNVGQNAIIKLLEGSGGVAQVQLVS
jgi:hypothetical protein